MADATFDGTDLIITLPAGEPIVDVEADLYSAWKRFMLADKLNMRFPLAFRTVGGDQLTAGIDAGAYFFLQNNLGWRIRPAEEDATVLVTGNLAPEDSLLPMTIPTVGAFTVLLQGLQPITQSVDALLLEQQNATYEGAVHINTVSGTAGTAFPVGTASRPVDNIADAASIATVRGFTRMNLTGSITLDRTFNFFKFFGESGFAVIDVNGQDVSACMFERVGILGDFSAVNPALPARLIETRVLNITDFLGIIFDSVIEGDISVAPGLTEVIRSASGRSGIAPITVDCQGNEVKLSFRGFDGGLDIRNFSDPLGALSVDSESLRLILGSTVTGGDIVVRGLGRLEDSSGPAASVNIDGFIDADVSRREHAIIEELRKLMRNKMVTDPTTGILTVFEDDGITVLFRASIFEDAAGLIAYQGSGAERRERLAFFGIFGDEFGLEFS